MKKKFLFCISFLGITALQGQIVQIDPAYIVSRYNDSTGQEVIGIVVPGKPPDNFRMPPAEPTDASYTLPEVPGYDWSFGCSVTSAAMMTGYYDRSGYPIMYTGPTNGGVAPLDNSVWGSVVINGEARKLCPISATRDGLDGRSIYGHVDDYWISIYNTNPDPYITYGWTQHTWGDCTGDFMKTNQSVHGNTDGWTTFWYYENGNPYSGNGSNNDGLFGLHQFFESRGYTVTSYFNQYIYGYNGNTLGFTFAQYKQQIDAGRPVLIQVQGHTMLGIGYNETGNIVYLRDTWDYITHQMTWGGTYSGMLHYAVGVIQLVPVPVGYTISGNFLYNNTVNTPLDSVKVVLKQGTTRTDSVYTTVTGFYEFSQVPNGTYTLEAFSEIPWGGVNGTDAIKTQRHFVGIELLTEPVRLLAADVNRAW